MTYRPTTMFARHRVGAALVATVALGASTLVGANLATADPAPTATQITITRVYTPSISVPDTPGAGESYVVKTVPFTVDLSTDYPLSYSRTVTVALTVTAGPADDRAVTVKYEFPANSTVGQITDVKLPVEGEVTIDVAVDSRKSLVGHGIATFDVLKTSQFAPSDSTLTGFGGGGGPGVRCSPSAADPVCGDLELPNSQGVLSRQLLSQGAGDSFLQVLVDVDPEIYNELNPILIVAKCDKTKCKGKGIRTYSVYVQIYPNTEPVLSPPCTTNGIITDGLFCTDYVQSTRDNAGDLLLKVLLAIDAKVIYH